MKLFVLDVLKLFNCVQIKLLALDSNTWNYLVAGLRTVHPPGNYPDVLWFTTHNQ